MWKYQAVAKESSHCWSGHGVPCAKERGIQSVKDTDKDLEDYQESGLLIWDGENKKCRNFDKCGWKLYVTRKRRLGDMIALPGVFKYHGPWKTI